MGRSGTRSFDALGDRGACKERGACGDRGAAAAVAVSGWEGGEGVEVAMGSRGNGGRMAGMGTGLGCDAMVTEGEGSCVETVMLLAKEAPRELAASVDM